MFKQRVVRRLTLKIIRLSFRKRRVRRFIISVIAVTGSVVFHTHAFIIDVVRDDFAYLDACRIITVGDIVYQEVEHDVTYRNKGRIRIA